MPYTVEQAPEYLAVRFPEAQRTLGWTLLHPGFALVDTVAWIEVRNADLTPEIDAAAFLRDRLRRHQLDHALAFMTARNIGRHHAKQVRVEDVVATCLTTVGLANGERIGSRRPVRSRVGTINTLVHVSAPLTEGAFLEAISIVAQARTVALLEARHSIDGAPISGTGTDCIVIAAPVSGAPLAAAGLHTAVGEAVGAATYGATKAGALEWQAEFASAPTERP
ncbi:MAG: adenosylcobinamide amidohydrolase [Proteobacteria bacterium]|nr:adenosylcobinamide amidohydrolase [Pseudomonadota bacterium]